MALYTYYNMSMKRWMNIGPVMNMPDEESNLFWSWFSNGSMQHVTRQRSRNMQISRKF